MIICLFSIERRNEADAPVIILRTLFFTSNNNIGTVAKHLGSPSIEQHTSTHFSNGQNQFLSYYRYIYHTPFGWFFRILLSFNWFCKNRQIAIVPSKQDFQMVFQELPFWTPIFFFLGNFQSANNTKFKPTWTDRFQYRQFANLFIYNAHLSISCLTSSKTFCYSEFAKGKKSIRDGMGPFDFR